MKNSFRRYLVAALSVTMFGSSALFAAEKLPRGEDVIDVATIGEGLWVHNLFQSNMVLQREKPIRVWGWATPGDVVTLRFVDQEAKATAAGDRSWTIELPAMPASSTPTQMVIHTEAKTVTLENLLLGDIWLLGGQSNMEHPLARVEDGGLEIEAANYPNMRILTVPAQNGPDAKPGYPRLMEWGSFFSRHYRKGYWEVCDPEVVRELSAIGYSFARRIHKTAQIPIGVIDISRGGTTVETWTPMPVLQSIATSEVEAMLAQWSTKVADYDPEKDVADQVKRYEQRVASFEKQGKPVPANLKKPATPRPSPLMNQNHPGNCYASMVAPIAGFPIKGAIWHQGYNNALQPEGHIMYGQVFPKMIDAWRAAFDDPAMPFGIISLCTAGSPQTLDNYLDKMIDEGVFIRAVQYQTFLDLLKAGDANIGFASSYDMRRSWYHPGVKIPVGDRIARWALATQYGQNRMVWKPPMVTDVTPEEGRLLLSFDTAVACQKDSPIEGFAIAGEDRRFQPASAEAIVTGTDGKGRPKRDSKTLVLSSPHVSEPTQFRYAWGRNPMGNLKPQWAQDGQPMATQRSDTWRIHEVPVVFGEQSDRRSIGEARKAARLFDMERRLKDAEALIETEHGKNTADVNAWDAKWASPGEAP